MHRLELLADMFADALSRKQSETAVLESKAIASTIFTSLYGHVAAIDRDRVIIAVNESSTQFARENGGVQLASPSARLPRGSAGRDEPSRHRIVTGPLEAVESVLEGRARQAVLEYAYPSGEGARSFEMAVEPFRRPQAAPSSPTSTSPHRRRAEEEARRPRES